MGDKLSKLEAVVNEVKKAVIGKDEVIELVLAAIIAGGHILLEDIPGVGKTTLALLFAKVCNAYVEQIPAVTSGVKDIRDAVDRALRRKESGIKTLVFVDEVHRFNKSQQDAFLPHIENGTIAFIGATTENPSFSLNSALLSRARVYV